MAKRRSHRRRKRTHHVSRRRRHRRMGAMALNPSSTLVQVGAVAIGYFLGDKINPLVDKVTGTLDAKIVSAIQVGLGGALVLGKIGKRNLVTVGIGGVVAGAGVKRALRSFGIITGYGQMQVVGRGVNGYQKMPTVGYNPQASLNGYPTAAIPINGMNVTQKIVGSVPGAMKGSGISTGSELMG